MLSTQGVKVKEKKKEKDNQYKLQKAMAIVIGLTLLYTLLWKTIF